jgi:hypothetical protein
MTATEGKQREYLNEQSFWSSLVVLKYIAYHYNYFNIFKTKINRYYFETQWYFTCCPFIPTCFCTTSILTAPIKMAAGAEQCGRGNK